MIFLGLRFPLNISSRADANWNFGRPKFPAPTSPEHPNFAHPKFSRIRIPASLRPQVPTLLLLPVPRTRLWMSKEPTGPIGPDLLREISACSLGTRFLKWTTPWCVHCYVPPPAHKEPVNFGHPKPLKATPEEADFERPKSHWSSPRATHPHRKHFGRPKFTQRNPPSERKTLDAQSRDGNGAGWGAYEPIRDPVVILIF